ncbi:hypothetical protein B6D60_04355 [candidate division KSB1 bacterium 4484_87]|nr:MAG: hypothetical protein B6D60_04355 [candidate division KSB1 bacterium 4484_87]
MKECPQQNLIVDYVFRELDTKTKTEFEAHLKSCQSCQQQLREFKAAAPVFQKARRIHHPKRPAQNYYKTLKENFYPSMSLAQRIHEWAADFFLTPSIAMRVAQAVAMLVVGVFLGRFLFFQEPIPVAVKNETSPILAANVSDQFLRHYLQETEMILLDVANTNPAEDRQILSSVKQLAIYRQLMQKTILCREHAEELNDDVLANLINEIELILLDLCNTEDENLIETLQNVRRQIKDSHILLEINSVESRGI